VISRRLCSGWLRPGSASAHVCSGLLTHLTRYRQLLTRGLKRPPFPARDPKSVPTAPSQHVSVTTHSQTVIPVCLSSCKIPTCRDIFWRLTSGCLTSFSAVCLGLLLYKWLSPSCLHIFSLPYSHPSSHPLLTHPPSHFLTSFSSSSHSISNPSYSSTKTIYIRELSPDSPIDSRF
jgi:hypothetical protein